MRNRSPTFTLASLSLTLLGCASSGTNLAHLTSVDELPNDDRRLWTRSAYEQEHFRNAGLIHPDSGVAEYVQDVGRRLVPEELRGSVVEFDFQIILDPEPNAFSLPDGQVFVHLGLLAWLDNESQLAHVLAHEIAHVVNRDAVSGYARRRNTILATRVLGWAAYEAMEEKADDSFWWHLASWTTQSAINVAAAATISGHGSEAERRADETALDYMVAAGYDITEAPRVFENLMANRPPSAPFGYFFVDPMQLQTRRDHLDACLAGGKSIATQSRLSHGAAADAAEYRRRTDSARRDLVELWVRNERYGRAIRAAEEVLREHPGDPRVWYWLGEARRRGATSPDALALARQNYLTASLHDSTFAEPHRGLGEIAESEGDLAEARRQYRMYLERSPAAKDRPYYAAKIEALEEELDH